MAPIYYCPLLVVFAGHFLLFTYFLTLTARRQGLYFNRSVQFPRPDLSPTPQPHILNSLLGVIQPSSMFSNSRTELLKLCCASQSPGKLLKTQISRPTARHSDSVDSAEDCRTIISSMLTSDANAAGLKTTLLRSFIRSTVL